MIDFDHTPFIIRGKRDLHCLFGDHYYNKKSSPSNKSDGPVTKDSEQPSQHKQVHTTEQGSNEQAISTNKSGSKLSLQGTRKIGDVGSLKARSE